MKYSEGWIDDKHTSGHEAWMAACAAFTPVHEDGKGHHGKYATYEAILRHIAPTLDENGLRIQQYPRTMPGVPEGVVIVTRVWHVATGEWMEDDGLWMPSTKDPQKAGAAITYGKRYGLGTFCGLVTTEDDDAQAASEFVRNPPPTQGQEVFAALKGVAGTEIADHMKKFAADREQQLTVKAMDEDPSWCAEVAEKLAAELGV